MEGQKVITGENLIIKWSAPQTKGNATISLYDVINGASSWDSDIAKDIPTTNGDTTWTTTWTADKETGSYKIAVWDSLNSSNIGWSGTFQIGPTSTPPVSLGDVSFLSSEVVTTSDPNVYGAKANFKVDVYAYPSAETRGCAPDSYRGFYELLAVYREKGATNNLYSITPATFYKTDFYPTTKNITLSEFLLSGKTYSAEFYLEEYPWGSCAYNKFLLEKVDFSTPLPPPPNTN